MIKYREMYIFSGKQTKKESKLAKIYIIYIFFIYIYIPYSSGMNKYLYYRRFLPQSTSGS